MRNYCLITAIVGLLFMGCTVDNDELKQDQDPIQLANVELSYNCFPAYDIESSGISMGNLVISNSADGTLAYLDITAGTGFMITEIKSMIAKTPAEFPQNKGGIIPGKLEKTLYDNLSVVQLVKDYSDSFVFTALITFVDEEGRKYSAWVGNELVGKNDSRYLSYASCPPNDCTITAGGDIYITWTESYIRTDVRSPASLERKLLASLDPGVPKIGIFDPTPRQLIDQYLNGQRFSTIIYTVTDGDCSDSTEIFITVIKD
jgi:hypothetical protein